MSNYASQAKNQIVNSSILIDCCVISFDDKDLRVLLSPLEGNNPEAGKFALINGSPFMGEDFEHAAERIVRIATRMVPSSVSQLIFGQKDVNGKKMIALSYMILVDPEEASKIKADSDYHWFTFDEVESLILASNYDMVFSCARRTLGEKIDGLSTFGFDLVGASAFTLPSLLRVFEKATDGKIDRRNFTKRMFTSDLLVKVEAKPGEKVKPIIATRACDIRPLGTGRTSLSPSYSAVKELLSRTAKSNLAPAILKSEEKQKVGRPGAVFRLKKGRHSLINDGKIKF